jgi:hypothetical protein
MFKLVPQWIARSLFGRKRCISRACLFSSLSQKSSPGSPISSPSLARIRWRSDLTGPGTRPRCHAIGAYRPPFHRATSAA